MITIKHLSLFDLILLVTSLRTSQKIVGEYQARFEALDAKLNEGIRVYCENRDKHQLKEEIHGIGLIMGKHDPRVKEVCELVERAVQVQIDLDEFKKQNGL